MVTIKRKASDDKPTDDCNGTETFTRFVYRPNWFVLSQTDGDPVEAPAIPDWDQTRALQALNVTEEPFALTDGNTQATPASGRLPSQRLPNFRTRPDSTNWPMSCSGTRLSLRTVYAPRSTGW